jgi:hypothetical protein
MQARRAARGLEAAKRRAPIAAAGETQAEDAQPSTGAQRPGSDTIVTPLLPGAPESGVSFAPRAWSTLMMPLPVSSFGPAAASRPAEPDRPAASPPAIETTGAAGMSSAADDAPEHSARLPARATAATAAPAMEASSLTPMRTVFLLLAGALMLATIARMAVG